MSRDMAVFVMFSIRTGRQKDRGDFLADFGSSSNAIILGIYINSLLIE